MSASDLRIIILSTPDDIRVNHDPCDGITFGHMAHGRIKALASVRKVVEGMRKGEFMY